MRLLLNRQSKITKITNFFGSALKAVAALTIAVALYACAPSQEEIVNRNVNILMAHFDVREAGARNTASTMSGLGIGEIDEITILLNDEYVKKFLMVDVSGHAYCIVMNGRGSLTYVYKDKPGGELLYWPLPE
jgi:hypothetical protein